MRLLRLVTSILSVLFVLLLLAMSAISTCTMRGDFHETTFFVSASPLPKICLLVLIVLALRFLRIPPLCDFCHRLDTDERFLEDTRRKCTLLLFFIAAFWVFVTQPTVISDQSEIQTAAEQINYHDYSCTKPEGYLSRYQHQIGVVLITALIQRVIGRDNYIVFQLMNALMAALTYYYLSRLAQHMKVRGPVQIGIFVLGILFFSYIFYATFIYPTIPSLLFSLIAFDLAARHERSPKVASAVLCALSMGLAVLLKQNALIFFIALIIYTVLTAWQSRTFHRFLLPVFLIIATFCAVRLPRPFLETFTHTKLADGISPYAYFAMGVQDGERAPGWYNIYINSVYSESGYSSEAQKEIALKDYTARLAYFKSHPADAVRFFLQKIASEWNNPTFEVFWINEVRGSNIRPATWVNRISRPTGVDFIQKYLNPLQFLILAFALIGLLSQNARLPDFYCLPLLTFVGGFICHIIWEAKCQYTLPYFILLLPYAAHGVSILHQAASAPLKALSSFSQSRKVCLALSVCLLLLVTISITRSGYLTGDNAAYAAYLTDVRNSK